MAGGAVGNWTTPRGYGPRGEAARGHAVGGPESHFALRARLALALTALVLAAMCLTILGSALAYVLDGHGAGSWLAAPQILLIGVGGLLLAAQSLWLLFVAIVRVQDGVLIDRPFVFRRARRYPRAELAWHKGTRFVGRFLVAKKGNSRRSLIALWLLSRRSQRRLFEWLDATAETAPHSPGGNS